MRGGSNKFTNMKVSQVATLFNAETKLEGNNGRSARLLGMRNEALCARYYYYMRYKHYNYYKACELLSETFFISASQVQKVLKSHTDILQTYKQQAVTVKQLSMQFTHLYWD
jgi:hypothetical protein